MTNDFGETFTSKAMVRAADAIAARSKVYCPKCIKPMTYKATGVSYIGVYQFFFECENCQFKDSLYDEQLVMSSDDGIKILAEFERHEKSRAEAEVARRKEQYQSWLPSTKSHEIGSWKGDPDLLEKNEGKKLFPRKPKMEQALEQYQKLPDLRKMHLADLDHKNNDSLYRLGKRLHLWR